MTLQYFNDQQMADLVNKLMSLTEANRLTWHGMSEETGRVDSQYAFGCVTGKHGFKIESKDLDDMAPHVLTVFARTDERMQELQEIDSTYVNSETAINLDFLYQLVKRKTLKTDLVATEVLDELDRIADEPPF